MIKRFDEAIMAKYAASCMLLKQFLKFGLVGISNTAVSLAVYYFCLWLGVSYLLSNTFAWIVGVANSFFWNYRYVFSTESSWLKTLWKTYVSYGGSFVLSMGLLYGLVEWLSVSEMLAPLAVLVVTVPLNFLLNKFWAFR